MIGKIHGKLIEKSDDHVIVDVNGVGYIIFVTPKTANTLSQSDKSPKLSLYTELLVKEDLLQLVGFITKAEKFWFNMLRSVQGVGAKVALAILNSFDTLELLEAVRAKNELAFGSVSGIGPRMAQRLIVELSGRKNLSAPDDKDSDKDYTEKNENLQKTKEMQKDALSALQNLGFKSNDAKNVVDRISSQNNFTNASDLVREALRSLAKG